MTERITGPHSTWQGECEALRARVAELEAALGRIIGMTDEIAKAPMTADRWADRIEDLARAALQEGGAGE